eukprot:TRINITY_DN71745_c0_g1_i1.p2 TRINITY_DN71745_c0_g1~~TRINITY_DN71745_c0_g1_i1.p2  ORF type:complete len:170 (+),score=48.68 TRINITY_DN71745_c0_g1_i1:73-510(+)
MSDKSWEFDAMGTWCSFGKETCAAIAAALESGAPTVDITEPGAKGTLHLAAMEFQCETTGGQRLAVREAVATKPQKAAPSAAAPGPVKAPKKAGMGGCDCTDKCPECGVCDMHSCRSCMCPSRMNNFMQRAGDLMPGAGDLMPEA